MRRRRRHLKVVRPGYRPPARRARDVAVALVAVAVLVLLGLWWLGPPAPPP